MKHRWPKSIHSQVEAVFHCIRAIRMPKKDCCLEVRGFGSWKVYRYEAHRFVELLKSKGVTSLLDTPIVSIYMAEYLEERLALYQKKRRSRQTYETILSALGKLEYAINQYIIAHDLDAAVLDSGTLRLGYYAKSKKLLRKSSRIFSNCTRAYPDPISVIQAIPHGLYRLQASLMYEGGLRTEGTGAPSNSLQNPLGKDGMLGIGKDPVSGLPVGIVASKEKGGKVTEHYVSIETYKRLVEHISIYGQLESDYKDYLSAINHAAKATGQYASGRGTHGLKHNFAQERYQQCIDYGLSHERALQQTSLELSHFRIREALSYTKGS